MRLNGGQWNAFLSMPRNWTRNSAYSGPGTTDSNSVEPLTTVGGDLRPNKSSSTTTMDQSQSRDKRYICVHPGCKSRFADANGLRRHQIFHQQRRFHCNIDGECSSSFYTKVHLERHVKKVHEKPKKEEKESKYHPCSKCRHVFKSKFERQIHEAVHTGDKPFKCNSCDESFALRSRLKRHLAIHSAQYPCKKCPFLASTWKALRKHMSQHKEKCPQCVKMFSSCQKLQIHLKTHQQVFQCPKCDKSYPRKCSLQAHMNGKHEEPKFLCEKCGKRLHYKKSIVYHVQRCELERSVDARGEVLYSCRKSSSTLLTGVEEVDPEEMRKLMQQDKQFRAENPQYNRKCKNISYPRSN